MGLWTVTSFVPSGKVASTCTSGTIPGTPSMTSSRVMVIKGGAVVKDLEGRAGR